MSTKLRVLLAGTASLLLISACTSEKPNASTVKEIAEVTVNGMVISKNRVDMLVKQSSGQVDNPEIRKDVIDQLTLQMLLADEATKKDLHKSSEVAEQVDLTRQSILANAYVQDFVKNNPVSDDMLKAEYEQIKSGKEYKARHILVEKEAEARDIIAQIKKDPGSFGKLAAEKSKDAASKNQGGDLGWFDAKRMVPEFSAAVSKLGKGKFTEEPVKTSFGYHVILLDDTKPVVAPPPFEAIKPNLTQQLQRQNLMKHLDSIKAKAKIEKAEASAVATK